MVEAIRHAQAAGDWAHAARLLADNYVDLVFDGRKATLRALLAAFPAGAPEADAELALAFATGSPLRRPARGERGRTSPRPSGWPRRCPTTRRRLFDLRLASARLWLACQRGDLATARQAMRLVRRADGRASSRAATTIARRR